MAMRLSVAVKRRAAMHDKTFRTLLSERRHWRREGAHDGVVFGVMLLRMITIPNWSAVSASIPTIELKFMHGLPAAPFPRLSRKETMTRRRPVYQSKADIAEIMTIACETPCSYLVYIHIVVRSASNRVRPWC